MAAKRKPLPFEPEREPKTTPRGSQVIPPAVANRMARRIGVATGVPSLLGMGVFIGSYLLVSRGLLDIPPWSPWPAPAACFCSGCWG